MTRTDPNRIATELFALLEEGDGKAYGGSGLSMSAHMLQTAALADRAGAPPALIVAALLHDIGHFGTDLPVGTGDDRHAVMRQQTVDRGHEHVGAEMLAALFGPEVADPVRLHVAAKRYLCATEPGYAAALSPTTRHTLALQGGVMTADEVRTFSASPHAADAVRLRRWDDAALVDGAPTPHCDHYRPVVEKLIVVALSRR